MFIVGCGTQETNYFKGVETKGQFLNVNNLKYSSNSKSGFTDNGYFDVVFDDYLLEETTFYIGNLQLGKITDDSYLGLTPLMLESANNTTATNILRLLYSLDIDNTTVTITLDSVMHSLDYGNYSFVDEANLLSLISYINNATESNYILKDSNSTYALYAEYQCLSNPSIYCPQTQPDDSINGHNYQMIWVSDGLVYGSNQNTLGYTVNNNIYTSNGGYGTNYNGNIEDGYYFVDVYEVNGSEMVFFY